MLARAGDGRDLPLTYTTNSTLHVKMRNQAAQERSGLERQLVALHGHMDAAYTDKLDGKISEEF